MTTTGPSQSTRKYDHSPFLAGIFSLFIPGSGQIYAGERYRGLSVLICTIAALGTAFWYSKLGWYFVPFVIWLWNVWDAVSLVKGKKRPVSIIVGALLVMGYAIGWHVTQIDLSALTKNLDRAYSIIVPMFHPDFIAHKAYSNTGWGPVEVPCGSNPPASENTSNGITVRISPNCASLNDTLIIQVRGLWPDTATELFWSTPIGDHLPLGEGHATPLILTSDSQGNLNTVIQVPLSATSAAPDPNLPLEHRVYLLQTRPLPGYQLSQNGIYLKQGVIETLFLALMSTTFGAVIAIPVGFLAARNLMGANPFTLAIYFVVRTVLNIIRSIEPLIIAIVFVVIVGLGPFPGVIAITLHTVAALGKLYSEVIEGIDPGPLEAIRATGGTWLQMVRYAVIPQIVPPFLSFTIYRWDINVRTSTIIGFVGGGGIGFYLYQWIIKGDYRAIGSAFIAIVIIVMILDFVSARIRARLV
ncbi:MAG TPA: phosphonate ABC transporter, permease protein PhnE [Anaerolineales bacterium]|nr:phosphonate ABC transporter, permease protein PhnE [Anaerolineales bacterium]